MVEVHFYSSETLAISRGLDGSVYSWDLGTGDMLKEFKQRGQGEAITCMDMCQEMSHLALGMSVCLQSGPGKCLASRAVHPVDASPVSKPT